MKTLPREQANVLWGKWWGEMRDEWFKVEVLQDYSGEDAGPSLEAWIKGDKQTSIRLIREENHIEWVEDCQKKLKQGVELTRIHLVEEPPTPYLEWEVEHYKLVNIAKCGESVYLLNRSEVKDLDIPAGDLMVFDKKRAVVNTYNSRGFMTHETFYDKDHDIKKFLELRKKLMERARPL